MSAGNCGPTLLYPPPHTPPQCPFSRVSSFLLLCHYYDSIPSQTEKELNEIFSFMLQYHGIPAVASLLLLRLTWQSSIICSYHVIWYILCSTWCILVPPQKHLEIINEWTRTVWFNLVIMASSGHLLVFWTCQGHNILLWSLWDKRIMLRWDFKLSLQFFKGLRTWKMTLNHSWLEETKTF